MIRTSSVYRRILSLPCMKNVIGCRNIWIFSKDKSIPTTRRASKVCTSLITANSDEEMAIYDKALLDYISYHYYPINTLDEYLKANPNYVMGNVICAISSILSGIGDTDIYYNRIKDTLLLDTKEKEYTKNEHIYGKVIAALRCSRIRYAINLLEQILWNDPVDILCTQTLISLYQILGENNLMYSSISRTWSYWGIGIPCDNLMAGYRAQVLSEMGNIEEAEQVGMKALSGNAGDVRAIHAVVHAMEMRGRTREGLRFLRETCESWSNHPVDYITGSFMEHHLLSHQMTLNLQVKQYGNVISILDNMLIRDEEMANDSTVQDPLTSDHINDCVHILYRMELLGEGMGERWQRLSALLSHTHKQLLTPMDFVYRALLFSAAGEEEKLRDLLAGGQDRKYDAIWESLNMYETPVKWDHINGNDRMDPINSNMVMHQTVDAILKLNHEHYEDSSDIFFSLKPSIHLLGGENRDRELITLSTFKALDGAKRYQMLERLLNEFTTQSLKRADSFYMLAECTAKMGMLEKAETLRDYAHNLGYEQGGSDQN